MGQDQSKDATIPPSCKHMEGKYPGSTKYCEKWRTEFGFDGNLDKPDKLRKLMLQIREKVKSDTKKEEKYGLNSAHIWYSEAVKRQEGLDKVKKKRKS